jgi:hypothetical protein
MCLLGLLTLLTEHREQLLLGGDRSPARQIVSFHALTTTTRRLAPHHPRPRGRGPHTTNQSRADRRPRQLRPPQRAATMAVATPPPAPIRWPGAACPSISHRLERSTVLPWMRFGHWGGGDMTRGGSRRLPGSGRPRRKPRRCRECDSIVTREGQERGKFFCHVCNDVLDYSETKTL